MKITNAAELTVSTSKVYNEAKEKCEKLETFALCKKAGGKINLVTPPIVVPEPSDPLGGDDGLNDDLFCTGEDCGDLLMAIENKGRKLSATDNAGPSASEVAALVFGSPDLAI